MIEIRKIRFLIIIIILLICFTTPAYCDYILVEGSLHSPGMVSLHIRNATPPYKIYKSTDYENYTFMMEIEGNNYIESGLENGKTYWYKVVDKLGNYNIVKQTIPYTTLSVVPLQVLEIADTYVQLEWNSFYSSVDLYVNGSLYESNIKESSITVDNLTPGTEYVFYYSNVGGELSNSIRVKTSKDLDNLMNRLDNLLTKLFVSDDFKIDSNNNGIVDGMEDIYNKGQEIINTPVIKYPADIGGIIESGKDNISTPSIDEDENALDKLPKFEVEIIPGYKVNLLNLEPFIKEIKLIRFVLVCMLYVELFFYFVKKLIPNLNA